MCVYCVYSVCLMRFYVVMSIDLRDIVARRAFDWIGVMTATRRMRINRTYAGINFDYTPARKVQ